MDSVCLFCKSYLPDLDRFEVLADSVRRFNRDQLKFFVSVPQSDLAAFKNRVGSVEIEWLSDEAIVERTSSNATKFLTQMPGMLTQQVVKAEFWRTELGDNYLCLDSDCVFIRPFSASDLLAADGAPYSVMHEGKAFRYFCRTNGLNSVVNNMDDEKRIGMELLGRNGPKYNFGPFPVIWSARVWKSLADNFLSVKGWSMFDAIRSHPHEATWYGEALLTYRAISVNPREPLFRAYLFLEEYEADRKSGITTENLAMDYLGVVYQSNWYPKRLSGGKNLAYKAKKLIKNIRGED